MRATLARLLTAHSVRTGHFRLASGKISPVYVDVKATSLTGEGGWLIGQALFELSQTLTPPPRAIGGLTLGADPLVTATSIAAHQRGHTLDAIIVRKAPKSHGTERYLESPPTLPAGSPVVAVDDVVTSGASTIQAIEALRQAGFQVDHALAVVDRQAGGREALASLGITLHALFTLDELTGS
ncbi:orotate phosphoribosyltransferase [Lujinxingia litoralis]|nr:orotate phosphoribosyltransferase [Lujinxingia litoralis]